jgi:hypothetical protein
MSIRNLVVVGLLKSKPDPKNWGDFLPMKQSYKVRFPRLKQAIKRLPGKPFLESFDKNPRMQAPGIYSAR